MSKDTTHKFPAQAPHTSPLSQLVHVGGNATILKWTRSLTLPELTETKSSLEFEKSISCVGIFPTQLLHLTIQSVP